MLKEVYYTYLGTNGTITSKVHLEDVYYIRKIKLIAEDGKYLTDGEKKVKTILVPEEEVEQWHEEFGQI